MIVAPKGADLIAADFSNVEGRVLAWLAGEKWKLAAFRDFDLGKGADIYKLAYAKSFGTPVEKVGKDQRQIGKVAELALGFGGGVGAFQAMAKNYGVSLPDAKAEEIKKAWRAAHPFINRYWYDLETAAIQAVETGGLQRVGACAYRKKGSFLWCQLPSGRVICYPYPQIREVDTPWGEKKFALTYMTVVSNVKAKTLPDEAAAGTWQRIVATPGHLAENVTQATARDILLDAMFRLDAQKVDIVFTVHDEVVIEVPEKAPEPILERVCGIVSTPPDWAKDLPLAAEGFRAKRYRK
jgi:DNA polymerase